MSKLKGAKAAASKSEAAPKSGAAIVVKRAISDRGIFAPICFLLLSLAYFHHFVLSDDILRGLDSGTDFHRGKEPVMEKIRQLDQSMWNPKMGGYPESEDLRWRYFPTYLIYLTTSFHRYIGWRYILTAFLAGCGMFLYLRGLNLGRWASLWGGVAFMSAPTFLSFTFAGHYAKMAVIALFPFMCLLLEKGMDRGRPIFFAGLAALIGLAVYSPHLQMLYYALWGIGFYFFFKLITLYAAGADRRRLLSRTALFAGAVALGLGLGSEGLWPSYFYSKGESKRAGGQQGRTAAEQLEFARSWSLHPEEVGSLLVPQWGGFTDPQSGRDYYWGRNDAKLNSEYFGISVLLLALVYASQMRRRWSSPDERFTELRHHFIFMLFLFVFALAYALGPHTPVHWIMYHLIPGGKVLRTPGMIAFLFAFPACVMAAACLDRFLTNEQADQRLGKKTLQVGAVLSGIALLVCLAPASISQGWSALLYAEVSAHKRQILQTGSEWLARGALYTALATVACTALLWLKARRQLTVAPVALGLCALTAADTWRINQLFFKYENPKRYPDMRMENRRTVAFLESEGELLRVLPLARYDLLTHPGYRLHGIPSVTGFHDFTIRRYDRLHGEIAHVISLLGQKHRDPQSRIPHSDDALLGAIHPLINLLNARYLVAPRGLQLAVKAFPAAFAADGLELYENPDAMPWFYATPAARVMTQEEQIVGVLRSGALDLRREVIIEKPPPEGLAADAAQDHPPARIEKLVYDPAGGLIQLRVECSSPRMLMLSENHHSNWSALVDGIESEIYRANYVWQAVFVPPGVHQVEFHYRSTTVSISRWISALSLLAIAAFGLVELVNSRRRADSAGQ